MQPIEFSPLRKIFANEVLDKFQTGRTIPLLVSGVCMSTQEPGEFVVKLRNNEITEQHYINELIGSLIALQLGLKVPEPVVINISENIQKAYIGKEYALMLGNSLGYCFGSQYINGFMSFTKNQILNAEQLDMAIKIFVFDAFILNPDRGTNPDKQNMFTDGKDICIFDHESAFGFIRDIFEYKTPWLLKEHDISWLKNHHFYTYVKDYEIKILTFIDELMALNDIFWNKVETIIPDEWKNDDINNNIIKIKLYLSAIIKNKEIFKEQFKLILL